MGEGVNPTVYCKILAWKIVLYLWNAKHGCSALVLQNNSMQNSEPDYKMKDGTVVLHRSSALVQRSTAVHCTMYTWAAKGEETGLHQKENW